LIPLPLQASPAPFVGAGELSAFASALVWGVATVLFTLAFKKGKARDAVLFKNGGGAILLGLVAWALGPDFGGGAASAGNVSWLLFSGFIGLGIGDWLYFVALLHIGVGRTLILTQTLPLATALAAWWTHGETLSGAQWFGALLIVSGGLLAESRRKMRDRADTIGILAALGAVLVFTIGNVTMREGVTETNIITGAAWRLAGGALGILVVSLLNRDLRRTLHSTTSVHTWKLFILPSAIGTWLGMSLLAGGFKWAKQGVASALSSAVPIISIPLAVVLLHEKPGWRGWSGAVLVVAGAATLGLAA
jgi:drug/metabolite transporter (DMT)-like permease